MAKKKNEQSKQSWNIFKHTKEETLQMAFSVVFTVLGIFFIMTAFEKGGAVGAVLYRGFKHLFGVGYFLLPLFFFVLSYSFFLNIKRHFTIAKVITTFLAFLSSLGIVGIIWRQQGGSVGDMISSSFLSLFGTQASIVILLGILAVSLILTFDTEIDRERMSEIWEWIKNIFSKKQKVQDLKKRELEDKDLIINSSQDDAPIPPKKRIVEEEEDEEEAMSPEKRRALEKAKTAPAVQAPLQKKEEIDESGLSAPKPMQFMAENYVPLPISLLENDKGKPGVGDIKANANIIKRTLQNFGITVEMDEISIGPSVTRYALKPAEGVKLSKIVGLQNDLSLALAAHPIRIEAPIPGKSLVGIEIPNSTKTTVGLGTLLSANEFQQSDKPLLVALGKGVSGKSHFSNLAKAPHLLIAGATGSGKSVTIHAIITSLLYRNSPQNLKFIMIDPKRVELTLYNKIPHLLTPVITEAKKAILSLKWAAKEMDRRYNILEAESVRDIQSYHKNVLEPALAKVKGKKPEELEGVKIPESMPYIVIVIDELADIMQTYPRELEAAIVRLAQMSRAVGIHLMLSTQRPSVNVITGLIKANVPSRIALQVASQIDSRTILDMAGAEKLLGAGDMLYLGGDMAQPQRVQSAYISETELKKVVKFLSENYITEIPTDITMTAEGQRDKNSIFESSFDSDEESLDDDDELYEDARAIVMEAGKASTSYIQRKLRVGYARAARLMDLLEQKGVIGPADGSKPRSVIGQEGSGGEDSGDTV